MGLNGYLYQNYNMTFVIILYLIYLRLRSINEHLDTLYIKIDKEITDGLCIVRKLIEKLCDIIENVKFIFAINTIFYFTHFTFFLIMLFFALISYIFRSDATDIDFAFCIVLLSWVFYYSPTFFFGILFACLIKREVQKTFFLITKLFLIQRDINVHENVKLTLMQLNHRCPLISCGMFDIDWRLLMSITGTVFSYLIILAQFDNLFSDTENM